MRTLPRAILIAFPIVLAAGKAANMLCVGLTPDTRIDISWGTSGEPHDSREASLGQETGHEELNEAANIVADAGLNRRASSGVLQLLPPQATACDGGFTLSSGAAAPNGAAALSVGLDCGAGSTPAHQGTSGQRGVGEISQEAGSSPARQPDRLLSALRDTESLGSDVSKPNRKGALGPYQFKRDTWNDHARGVPWAQAVDEPTARVVAVRYLAWLDCTITKWSGKPATLDQVLAAWNGGIGTLRSVGFDPAAMPYEESRAFPGKVQEAMRCTK